MRRLPVRIRIEKEILEDWVKQLKLAGPREIGGVLFGEQLNEGYFRIVKAPQQISQTSTGSRFCRDGVQARKVIKSLHSRYGGQAERFNYLGEWHSHPDAPTLPSPRDETTMLELVAQQDGAVNFLVLVILRLSEVGALQFGARAYLASGHALPCAVEAETETPDDDD